MLELGDVPRLDRDAGRNRLAVYVGRIREFTRTDWLVYVAWVGTMLGLVCSTGGFLVFGYAHGVALPRRGAGWCRSAPRIFTIAIAIDTIGHRTVYKEVLKRRRSAWSTTSRSCAASPAASCWCWPTATAAPPIPAMVLTVLSFVYSLVDEAFHWRRYVPTRPTSSRCGATSFIFVGHGIMMLGWWWFYALGYPGVRETLAALR